MDEVDRAALKSALEAVLFASGEPIGVDRLALVLETDRETVLSLYASLAAEYETQGRGFRVVRLNDDLQMHSAPEYAQLIARALEQRRAPKLSQASLEVLAVVAYFQPVTRAYIDEMRGVDSSYTVGLLTERGLIEPAGTLDAVGRPTLYRTTELFLRTMRISNLEQLPPLPEVAVSDAAIKLQQQVDALRAAEEADEALEAASLPEESDALRDALESAAP